MAEQFPFTGLVPVEHDPFNPDQIAAGGTAISANDPRLEALTNTAKIQDQRFAAPQQTQEGYPFYQAGNQPSYPEAAQAPPPTTAVGPETPLSAYEYGPELADPRVRDRLMAYTQAEVGNQGPQAQQSFIEATIRRAKIEGRTIDEVLSRHYFPGITHVRALGGVSDNMRSLYGPMIDEALSGSNISNWATGNASGTVGFAGGPLTARAGGEKFGIEGWTLPAIRAAMAGGDLVPVDYDPFERAAARTRLSVRPEGGRQEGGATRLLERFVPSTAYGIASFPQRYTEAAQGVTRGEDTGIGGTNFELLQYMMGAPKPTGAVGMAGGRLPRYRPGEPTGFSLEDTFNAPPASAPAVPQPKLVPVEHNPFAWTGSTPMQMHETPFDAFHGAIGEAKRAHPSGAAVTQYSPEEYSGMRTFTSADGQSGFALKGDDIVSVFKHPESPQRNAAQSMLSTAVAQGGRRLDAFDTVLPHIYGKAGFRAVARMPFDPKYAPEGWNYNTFAKYNGGKPDVVFMVHDPYRPGYTPGEGVKVGSYAEAEAIQKQAADAVSQRKEAGRQHFNEVAQQVTGLKGMGQYLTPEELERVTARNAQKLVEQFRNMPPAEEMAAAAYAGRAKRGWYAQSARAIIDLFGAADGRRFSALLAALSPQSSVESNTINALRVWNEWSKAGRPTDSKGIVAAMGRGVQGTLGEESVLNAWKVNTIRALTAEDPAVIQLSGPKVNSFMKNLQGEVNEVTNDTWMANFAGIDQKQVAAARIMDPNPVEGFEPKIGVKSPGYLAMSVAIRRAAKTLSAKTGDLWTPAEIQETVWSWAKSLAEKVASGGIDATAKKLLKAGGLTHEEIATTPDFALLFTNGIYRKILEEGGYGPKLGEVERSLAGRSAGGGAPASKSSVSAQGSGFTQGDFERYLRRAGERLDLLQSRPQP